MLTDPREPFEAVVPALRGLQDADVEIEFRFEMSADFALPEAVPAPPEVPFWGLANPYPRCGCRSDLVGIDAPLADMGEMDKGQEEDDRIVLNLDREGNVVFKEPLSLDGLSEALRSVKARYHTKMRQQGKSGFETEDGVHFSKVYVLIRADRAASATHVGFLLHVLAEEGFYKIQFAVSREIGTPGPCVTLDAKIQAFLPADALPGIVSADEPVHVYVDPTSYGVGAARGGEAGQLCALVQREAALADRERKFVVAMHVAPGVSWDRVVAAVNEVNRAGVQKIDFHDLPAPDALARKAIPLPR